jgi:hypothetical protein
MQVICTKAIKIVHPWESIEPVALFRADCKRLIPPLTGSPRREVYNQGDLFRRNSQRAASIISKIYRIAYIYFDAFKGAL